MTSGRYHHALITGGAGGIGKSIAACFLREGCRVTLVDQNSDGLERIRSEWPEVGVAPMDITDTFALRRLVIPVFAGDPQAALAVGPHRRHVVQRSSITSTRR